VKIYLNTLKIDYSGRNFNFVEKGKKIAYGECRKNLNDTVRFLVEYYLNVGFAKCKVKRAVNLFEDTGSVRELNTLLIYPDRVLVLHGRIKASSIINYVQMLSSTL
jgi:hypothetical protein